MVVLITNLTDAPGHATGPTQIDIYNKTLDPGSQLKLPADLVDKKVRSLAEGKAPLIAIGSLPPWYIAAKKRKGTPLTNEERQKMQPAPQPVIQMKVIAPEERKMKPIFDNASLEEVGRKSNKG